MINSGYDMLDNSRSAPGSATIRMGRVGCVCKLVYNCHPNGLKKTYTTPEETIYTYYDDGQDSPSAVGAGRAGTACKNNQFTAIHIPGSGQLSRGSFYWLQPQTLLLPGGSQVTLSYDDFLQVKDAYCKTRRRKMSPRPCTTMMRWAISP